MKKNKPIKGYLCGVAYQYEVGPDGAHDGVHVYPSKKAIKHYSKCCKDCGIVEFIMTDFKWVQKQKPFSAKNCLTPQEAQLKQIELVKEDIAKKKAFLERLEKELSAFKADKS